MTSDRQEMTQAVGEMTITYGWVDNMLRRLLEILVGLDIEGSKHDRDVVGRDLMGVADRLELVARAWHSTLPPALGDEVIAVVKEARSVHARRTWFTHAHPWKAEPLGEWKLKRVRREETFTLDAIQALNDRCHTLFLRVGELAVQVADEGEIG